jgi:hypothetical protein
MADQSQVGTYYPRVVTMAPSLVSLRPAPQISHLAGADERDARRYQATRRRGAWWATRRELVEPTADEWAMRRPAGGSRPAEARWVSGLDGSIGDLDVDAGDVGGVVGKQLGMGS